MKVVAFVPIKLNSQRLPHKNILPVAGRPLCYHICRTLANVKAIDETYVYCSDPKVTDYIPEDVTFLQRDAYLDGNLVKEKEIYERFIAEVDADIYILAQNQSIMIWRMSQGRRIWSRCGWKRALFLSFEKRYL